MGVGMNKRISIQNVLPGMVVAEDVYTINNQLVIPRGTVITDRILKRLKDYSIYNLTVLIPEKPEPIKTVMIHSEKIKNSPEFKQFNEEFLNSVNVFKAQLSHIVDKDNPIDQTNLLADVSKTLSETRNGIHLFDMLHCMRESDDIAYVHSLNVALICNVFGHWLKLSEDDIEVLTLCGLLHDIGKLKLPHEILYKEEPLTQEEYEILKTHPSLGYEILKYKDLDQRIVNAAFMHQERCDGSGYPRKLQGEQIDSFAKIVAIADVYDAMTSARVYRPALSPFDAIRNFESVGLQKFDPHYIMTFLEGIVNSYVGNHVRLNNNAEGEIILINKQALSKPVIKSGDTFIDLSKEHHLHIVAVL
jgi:putative nucleotidyltransferase with HDIG domain